MSVEESGEAGTAGVSSEKNCSLSCGEVGAELGLEPRSVSEPRELLGALGTDPRWEAGTLDVFALTQGRSALCCRGFSGPLSWS